MKFSRGGFTSDLCAIMPLFSPELADRARISLIRARDFASHQDLPIEVLFGQSGVARDFV